MRRHVHGHVQSLLLQTLLGVWAFEIICVLSTCFADVWSLRTSTVSFLFRMSYSKIKCNTRRDCEFTSSFSSIGIFCSQIYLCREFGIMPTDACCVDQSFCSACARSNGCCVQGRLRPRTIKALPHPPPYVSLPTMQRVEPRCSHWKRISCYWNGCISSRYTHDKTGQDKTRRLLKQTGRIF